MDKNRIIKYPYEDYEIYDRIPPVIEAMSLEEIEEVLEEEIKKFEKRNENKK